MILGSLKKSKKRILEDLKPWEQDTRHPITPPVILTLSPVLPPSPLFDPRLFFVPEELLPPKKQIHPQSSSSTMLSNSSRKQAWILEDKIICDLDKTPDLSQQSPQNYPKCGHQVNGHYCQGCALLRKKFKEDLFASCIENGILQDSSKPSNENTNVVNAPQGPFVGNQDPGIFCHQCTCKLCRNAAHYGYNCLPKVVIIPDPEPFNNQTIKELPPTVLSFDPKFDLVYDSPNVFDAPPKLPFYSCEFCGNDARYGHYCIRQVPFVYPELCYNQDFNFPQDFHEFQQQDLCCENCEQYTVNHLVFNVQNDLFDSQNKLMEQLTSIMGDEHLDTVPVTESDEFIKSSVENLVPNPSEFEGESECDVPAYEEFTTFSNVLFDSNYDFYSSDDRSFSNKDFPKEIYSNPLFDEEIISINIDKHHFNAESDLIVSILNHDSSIISSSKIDSLFDEFASELTLLKSIPRGPILVEDSDSLMEEINLYFTLDYLMSPGIEEDDYDSERDILILEELFRNDSLLLPENESFHFDILSSFRPPAKPPYGNTGILNVKMMGDIFEQKLSAECLMMIHGKNTPILDVPLFHFYPLDQFNIPGNVKTLGKGFCTQVFISPASIRNHIDSLFDEFASELTLLKSIPRGIDETDYYPEEETHFT
nr:hypothetical protein [Tanacetum cinerariifolium]